MCYILYLFVHVQELQVEKPHVHSKGNALLHEKALPLKCQKHLINSIASTSVTQLHHYVPLCVMHNLKRIWHALEQSCNLVHPDREEFSYRYRHNGEILCFELPLVTEIQLCKDRNISNTHRKLLTSHNNFKWQMIPAQ